MPKRPGESQQHLDLKRRALIWAQAHDFNVCATEVKVPRSGFRADVAACSVATHSADCGETAIFECKQARADLLRDSAAEGDTLVRLRRLSARRMKMEETLGLHLPDLRRGESLFAEFDSYDFDSIRHVGLRSMRREESVLKRSLFGRTKFDRMRRYACADRLYLVVSAGIIGFHETPEGWGLLEAKGDGLELIRRPGRIGPSGDARRALLHAVAAAASRTVNREFEISFEEIQSTVRSSLP